MSRISLPSPPAAPVVDQWILDQHLVLLGMACTGGSTVQVRHSCRHQETHSARDRDLRRHLSEPCSQCKRQEGVA